jgi:hypothetical protein
MTTDELKEFVLEELIIIRHGVEADRFTIENIRDLEKRLKAL